jgi:hypothetical protein
MQCRSRRCRDELCKSVEVHTLGTGDMAQQHGAIASPLPKSSIKKELFARVWVGAAGCLIGQHIIAHAPRNVSFQPPRRRT